MPTDSSRTTSPESTEPLQAGAEDNVCAANAWQADFEESLRGIDSASWLEILAARIRQTFDLFALGWWEVDRTQCLTGAARFSHHLPHAEPALERVLMQAAEQAAAENAPRLMSVRPTRPTSASPNQPEELFTIIAVRSSTTPTCDDQLDERPSFVLAGAFRESTAAASTLIAVLHAASLAWQVSQTSPSINRSIPANDIHQELAIAAAIIDLAVRLEACETLDAALQQLVTDAARHTGCRLVAVGMLSERSQTCVRYAVSDQTLAPTGSDEMRAIEAALDEIVIREEATQWPATSSAKKHGMLTHRRLLQVLSLESVVGAPLQTAQQDTIGAWLFVGGCEVANDPSFLRFAEAAGYRLSASLGLIRRAEQSALRRLIRRGLSALGMKWKTTLVVAVTVLAGLLFLPVPYRVACDCELQPVVRRYVAAPFEGTLEKSFVEPGESVRVGQLLARMDAREIQWELAGLNAEHSRALKERDGHMAKQDISAAEISRFDMERLQNRRDLLTHRSEHLEIRSPLTGLVITGDLKRSEGVPLKTGDRLFEIAPLDQMLVEVAIPEPDIRHVSDAQQVTVLLDAFPNETLTGKVKRIHPRSEVRDEQHVFIAEVELDAAHDRLRPGMKGAAKISAGSRQLGWIAFHRPWEAFLMWVGW